MNQLLGKSIKDLINFYLVAIYKIDDKPTWKNRLTARFNRSNLVFWCRHGVCIFFKKCAECDARNRDNITFLRQLKPKVLAFFSSREFWLGLDGISFEQQVSQLFKQLGKAVELTKASGDGGVDIFLRDDSGLTASVSFLCRFQSGRPSLEGVHSGIVIPCEAKSLILQNVPLPHVGAVDGRNVGFRVLVDAEVSKGLAVQLAPKVPPCLWCVGG
jgi:hypothetical protein